MGSTPEERQATLNAIVAKDEKRILEEKSQSIDSPEAQKKSEEREERLRKWRIELEKI